MVRTSLLLVLAIAFPLFAADTPQPPADLTNPPADAEKSDDGLVTKQLVAGSGTEHPTSDDIVKVRYTVWKSDGTLVQHVAGAQHVMLAVPKMIRGWGAAVQKMVAGEQRRAWIPAALAGGKTDLGLVIDTTLLEVFHRPVTPEDVAEPPADAHKTPSGLAYKVLRAGTGERRPLRGSTVAVHYSGWTTDGKMFDSSVLRGTPSEFRLSDVIKGWTEGLQLMKTGEKTRFWIPSNLAYGRDQTKPQGTLVFDIELIEIK